MVGAVVNGIRYIKKAKGFLLFSKGIELDDGKFVDGVWKMEITPNEDNDSIVGNEIEDEEDHFTSACLYKMEDGGYRYEVTISDVDMDSWYRVWEMHMDVPGFTLTSSVEAETTDGHTAISNYLTTYEESDGKDEVNDHGGRAFAFELTESTTVHFTNTYSQGALSVTKQVTGLDNPESSNEEFTFTVSIPAEWAQRSEYNDGKYPVTYSRSGTETKHTDGTLEFTVTKDQEVATATLKLYPGETATIQLPTGIEPVVTETIHNGYTASWSKGTAGTSTPGDSITADEIQADQTSSVTCYNTPTDKVLTVTKTVTGAMGSTETDFDFELVLTDVAAPDTLEVNYDSGRGVKEVQKGEDSSYHFVLKDGETIQITIPYGATAVVTETEANGYEVWNRVDHTDDSEDDFDADGKPIAGRYQDSNATSGLTMNEDHSAEFVNFRPVVPPTGLESNHTTPYGLMVGAAGVAGAALVGSVVVRRRRRRQE